MIQVEFANRARTILETNEDVVGLAVGGSWLTNQIDEYSDLDLILVTKNKISSDKNQMLDVARQLGNLLAGFTGEHVGEPRVLICLYDDPLLHVDLKFVTLEEFHHRVETPYIFGTSMDYSRLLSTKPAQTFRFPIINGSRTDSGSGYTTRCSKSAAANISRPSTFSVS